MTFQTYNLGVPNPPNRPSSDVPLMQTNTNSISALLLQDHFGFNNSAGGNHKQVHLKNTVAPGGIGANADSVFYANLATGQSWPFWQNALGSFQLLGNNNVANPGFLTLGGIIIQWGVVSVPSGLGGPFNFPTAFNSFFSISLTMDRNSTSSTSYDIFLNGTPSTTQFRTNSGTSGSHDVYFIAIGK